MPNRTLAAGMPVPDCCLWLSVALDQLCVSRRLLTYSYVFAFYMFGGSMFKDDVSPEQNAINQNLFEDRQQSLEETVEQLSKRCDTAVGEMDDATRLAVVNLTALADTKCAHLATAVEDDLLGSLECSSQHIAPYVSRLATRPGKTGAMVPSSSAIKRKR